MIPSLIYRFAGVSSDIPITSSEIEIKRDLNIKDAPSVKELREEQQKTDETIKPRWWEIIKVQNDDSVGIDWKVEIPLPNVVRNAQQWNSIREAAQNVKIGSIVAGIGFLVVGAWKSIPDRSPLKALVTIIMTFAAAYFAKQAQLMEEKAANEHELLNSLDSKETVWNQVREFRMTVLEKGLSQISSSIELLPKALKARAIELLTDDEIQDLFEEHVQKLLNPYSPLGLLIMKDDLFESLFKKLPKPSYFSPGTPVYQAIQACNNFKNSLTKEQVRSRFEEFKREFCSAFSEFKDKTFLKLLTDRLNDYFYYFNESKKFESLESIFSGQLPKLFTEPYFVRDYMESKKSQDQNAINTYYNTIIASQFKNIFKGEIFNQGNLKNEEYQNYIEWAKTQFKSMPEDTKNRGFLISCLPQ